MSQREENSPETWEAIRPMGDGFGVYACSWMNTKGKLIAAFRDERDAEEFLRMLHGERPLTKLEERRELHAKPGQGSRWQHRVRTHRVDKREGKVRLR